MGSHADNAARKYYHPYEPYDIQLDLMRVIYDCIEEGKIGILESPTGTGKSLSLLCGSLTWLRNFQGSALENAQRPQDPTDEPLWVVEHEAEEKRRTLVEQKATMEARLNLIRAKELRQKRDYQRGESKAKRVKTSESIDQLEKLNDNEFELEDYESEDEVRKKAPGAQSSSGSGLSAESLKLMQKLGLVGQAGPDDDQSLDDETKIFFCSRTHSQLTQFVQEVRKAKFPGPPGISPIESFNPDYEINSAEVKHLPLGSRKNLCINPRVSKLGSAQAITEKCLELQQPGTSRDHRCSFIPSKDNETLVHQFRDHVLAKVRDIEDLGALGQQVGICPYYASRETIKPSEIVTLPYPLLLQKSARDALDLSLKGHVIIIDEAHNLMDTITNIHSITVSGSQLKRCRAQLGIYLQKFRNRLKGKNRVYIAQVVRLIDSIADYLASKLDHSKSSEGTIAIVDLMAGKGTDQINLHKLVHYLQESKLARKIEGYIACTEQQQGSPNPQTGLEESRNLPVLSQVQSFIQTLANPAAEGRFFYERDKKNEPLIRYTLLDPTFHFKAIVEEARAVILAGGTMSPMEDYRRHLLGYVEPGRIRTFSCGHIIPKQNLIAQIFSKGINDVEFDFTFGKRDSLALIESLGSSLIEVMRCIPDGLVVFFPSYAYLDFVVATWKKGSIWGSLENHKPIFQESKSTTSVDSVLSSYSEAIARKRGGLLLSVIGGKLSEGINFSDALGRGVAVVGMPFPNVHSAQWKAKLEYIEQSVQQSTGRAEEGKAAARSFVENACMRAVNQSIGRAIRHKNDYASILFFDKRYRGSRIQDKLPAWIRQGIVTGTSDGFGEMTEQLRRFFEAR